MEDYEPTFGKSMQILNSSIQDFGISIGDAIRGLLLLRAPYDFSPSVITAPDGIPISDTEYADLELGKCVAMD